MNTTRIYNFPKSNHTFEKHCIKKYGHLDTLRKNIVIKCEAEVDSFNEFNQPTEF